MCMCCNFSLAWHSSYGFKIHTSESIFYVWPLSYFIIFRNSDSGFNILCQSKSKDIYTINCLVVLIYVSSPTLPLDVAETLQQQLYLMSFSHFQVNKFISVPKDKGSLNCAVFNAGIIEAVLTKSGFVSIHDNTLTLFKSKWGYFPNCRYWGPY